MYIRSSHMAHDHTDWTATVSTALIRSDLRWCAVGLRGISNNITQINNPQLCWHLVTRRTVTLLPPTMNRITNRTCTTDPHYEPYLYYETCCLGSFAPPSLFRFILTPPPPPPQKHPNVLFEDIHQKYSSKIFIAIIFTCVTWDFYLGVLCVVCLLNFEMLWGYGCRLQLRGYECNVTSEFRWELKCRI